jgi:hypothetical protein
VHLGVALDYVQLVAVPARRGEHHFERYDALAWVGEDVALAAGRGLLGLVLTWKLVNRSGMLVSSSRHGPPPKLIHIRSIWNATSDGSVCSRSTVYTGRSSGRRFVNSKSWLW